MMFIQIKIMKQNIKLVIINEMKFKLDYYKIKCSCLLKNRSVKVSYRVKEEIFNIFILQRIYMRI